MKSLLSLLLLALPLVACLEESDDSNWNLTENNQTQNNQNNNTTPDPKISPVLSAEFVSGHLGNYVDCPEQGYDAGARSAEPGGAGLWEGDCAEDGCGILNCEGAQVTFTLKNEGRVEAQNLRITSIELFNTDGLKVADLPLESVQAVETGEPLANVGGDSQGMFYMFFKGPAQPYELLEAQDGQWGRAGILLIKLKADNHAEFTLETPNIYVLDNIAT